MARIGKWDSAIIGGILGLIVFQPSIGNFFKNIITDIIPSSWNWFGSYTLTAIGVAIGFLIGLIADRTGK